MRRPTERPPRIRIGAGATAVAVLVLGAALLVPQSRAATPALAMPAADPVTGHCQGQCADILPPGRNGNATLADILGNRLFGTSPAHASDQLARYDSLVAGRGGLTHPTVNWQNRPTYQQVVEFPSHR
ncbi:hypothetical protein [Streptomyces sp. NPDC088554]|uniref:hypothetical protein n=1 Tax=Streptomyces sp. NPDC088554 TaxID=3365865 RepID=UPI00380F0F24